MCGRPVLQLVGVNGFRITVDLVGEELHFDLACLEDGAQEVTAAWAMLREQFGEALACSAQRIGLCDGALFLYLWDSEASLRRKPGWMRDHLRTVARILVRSFEAWV